MQYLPHPLYPSSKNLTPLIPLSCPQERGRNIERGLAPIRVNLQDEPPLADALSYGME